MDDFHQIKLALKEINQTLLTQSMEIAELLRQVQGLVQATTQPSKYTEIEPDSGVKYMPKNLWHFSKI